MDAWLQRIWYGRSALAWLLLPLAAIFWLLAAVRRTLFRFGVLKRVRVAQPVIIVGNISVGGTGKTPLVIWLAQQLASRGHRPAVITRGYGGASSVWPRQVLADSDPALVGDESVLIAQQSGVRVFAGPDRVAAARLAIAGGADVIVSDDGLQHYRLGRDFEIAVVDGARGVGNGLLLPAGPLRESKSRLESVDVVAVTTRSGQPNATGDLARYRPITVCGEIHEARSVVTSAVRPLSSFAATRVHALAGIGNPEAFFAGLRAQGLDIDARSLPDHVQLTRANLDFGDDAPVLMTEKDAVKCRAFADERCWAVPLRVEVEGAERLLALIEKAIAIH